MIFATGARAFSILLAGLFALAAIHKGRALAHGEAGQEPLLRTSGWRVQHAEAILATVGVIETMTAALLLVIPAGGFATATPLMLLYAVELRRLDAGQECNCFGSLLPQERTGAIRRNLLLSGLSAVVLVALIADLANTTRISQAVVGTALIGGSLLGAQAALGRVTSPSQNLEGG